MKVRAAYGSFDAPRENTTLTLGFARLSLVLVFPVHVRFPPRPFADVVRTGACSGIKAPGSTENREGEREKKQSSNKQRRAALLVEVSINGTKRRTPRKSHYRTTRSPDRPHVLFLPYYDLNSAGNGQGALTPPSSPPLPSLT